MDYGPIDINLPDKGPDYSEIIKQIQTAKKEDKQYFDFVFEESGKVVCTIWLNKLNGIQKLAPYCASKYDEEFKALNLELLRLQVQYYKELNEEEGWKGKKDDEDI